MKMDIIVKIENGIAIVNDGKKIAFNALFKDLRLKESPKDGYWEIQIEPYKHYYYILKINNSACNEQAFLNCENRKKVMALYPSSWFDIQTLIDAFPEVRLDFEVLKKALITSTYKTEKKEELLPNEENLEHLIEEKHITSHQEDLIKEERLFYRNTYHIEIPINWKECIFLKDSVNLT